MRWPCALALSGCLLAGCTGSKPVRTAAPFPGSDRPSPSTAPGTNNRSGLLVTPGGSLRGKVASVNPEARFVVLGFSLGSVPAVGERLNVYRKGLKVGELKVSGPQRDNNTVADIVAGECRPGDEVRED